MDPQDNLLDSLLTEDEAELAKVAQRCLVKALDHSRAHKIRIIDESGDGDAPVLEVPPKALRLFAEMLGAMSQRQPISVIPQKHEVSTQDAAAFLNVSRPFVIKQIEGGKLKCRKVGRHRRVEFEELVRFQKSMRQDSEAALQALAEQAQDLKLGY